jgi:hypothetical protein
VAAHLLAEGVAVEEVVEVVVYSPLAAHPQAVA